MRHWIKTQFARAEREGWIPYFIEAEERFTAGFFDAADLMGIGSRETNLDPKWLRMAGDHGNGFGLMQADKRYFPDWVRTGKWRDAREGILKGAEILMMKWDEVQRGQGKRLSVKSSRSGRSYKFIGAPIDQGFIAQRVTLAAYNSGLWGYYNYSKGADPDRFTTGKDYSADVIGRAREFRVLLNDWKRRNVATPNTPQILPSDVEQAFSEIDDQEPSQPIVINQIEDINEINETGSEAGISDSNDPLNSPLDSLSKQDNDHPGDNQIPASDAKGDAPDVEPKVALKAEDWRSKIWSYVKWAWGGFGAFNTTQAMGFVSAAVNDPVRAPYYIGGAGILGGLTLLIVLIATGVLAVWAFMNRRELNQAFTGFVTNLANPNTKNYGLLVENMKTGEVKTIKPKAEV